MTDFGGDTEITLSGLTSERDKAMMIQNCVKLIEYNSTARYLIATCVFYILTHVKNLQKIYLHK